MSGEDKLSKLLVETVWRGGPAAAGFNLPPVLHTLASHPERDRLANEILVNLETLEEAGLNNQVILFGSAFLRSQEPLPEPVALRLENFFEQVSPVPDYHHQDWDGYLVVAACPADPKRFRHFQEFLIPEQEIGAKRSLLEKQGWLTLPATPRSVEKRLVVSPEFSQKIKTEPELFKEPLETLVSKTEKIVVITSKRRKPYLVVAPNEKMAAGLREHKKTDKTLVAGHHILELFPLLVDLESEENRAQKNKYACRWLYDIAQVRSLMLAPVRLGLEPSFTSLIKPDIRKTQVNPLSFHLPPLKEKAIQGGVMALEEARQLLKVLTVVCFYNSADKDVVGLYRPPASHLKNLGVGYENNIAELKRRLTIIRSHFPEGLVKRAGNYFPKLWKEFVLAHVANPDYAKTLFNQLGVYSVFFGSEFKPDLEAKNLKELLGTETENLPFDQERKDLELNFPFN